MEIVYFLGMKRNCPESGVLGTTTSAKLPIPPIRSEDSNTEAL